MAGIVAADMRPHAGWVGIHRDPRGRARSDDGSAGVRLQSDGPRGVDQGPGRRTVRIDRYEAETCDDSLIAVTTTPTRRGPRAAHAAVGGGAVTVRAGPTTLRRARALATPAQSSASLWRMTLWGTVLAALALMLLVRRVADDLAPGYGTASAVTLGLATLLLPFSPSSSHTRLARCSGSRPSACSSPSDDARRRG